MTITQGSDRAVINWDSFSVGRGETVTFVQPDAESVTANRVLGLDPSVILGSVNANGQVVLVNRNGILFGQGSRVDASGLVATTLDFDDAAFMAGGELRFSATDAAAASVVNEGYISISNAGMAAFVAPHVRNSGVISANLGRVALGAGTGFTLDLYGDGLIRFEASDSVESFLFGEDDETALVEQAGEISASGGRILLTASAAREVVNQSVNISGIVRADTVSQSAGVITLSGSGSVKVADGALVSASGARGGGLIEVDARSFTTDGLILAGGTGAGLSTKGDGGTIRVTADHVGLGGTLSASGRSGGEIAIASSGQLFLAENVFATGAAGQGGTISYEAGRILETSTGRTNAQGLTHGGMITVDGGLQVATSGQYLADGIYGRGGQIDFSAGDVRLLSAGLSASGFSQGGLVRVGGAFQGGKTPDTEKAYYGSFLGRWGELSPIGSADAVFVGDASWVDVSAASGLGGTAVIWSDKQTTFLGGIDARGGSGGGSVEISSGEDLRQADLDTVWVGDGHLLLDPKNIIIGTGGSVADWSYAGIMGVGYGKNLDFNVDTLGAADFFGAAVSLNAAGDRLAVGAYGDDGSVSNTGAVYLFSFTNSNFANGTLEAVLGSGYTGGKNVDVALGDGDVFGSSVSLNAAGNRLAVGAPRSDGDGDLAADSGAVYLFSFSDTVFSGGTLEAVLGSGYSGGKNVDVANLEAGDGFGAGVSLNAAGDRLAIGARQDEGAGNAAVDAGAVYLYSFSDTAFSGGAQEAVIGSGYSGGKNVDVANLDTGDDFGFDVSLNASGDLLAVGARFDDGNGNAVSRAGAVYLFSFTDTDFSGGTQEALMGSGYSGGKNVDMTLASDDFLGVSVSLNAVGNRLAVGAYRDDGAADAFTNPGAVYLFSFSDTAFSGTAQEAVLGAGYSGGKNVDVTNLETDDYFGYAVSLNAAGDRLAVGASDEDGAGNSITDAGAVYLFSFSDTDFSDGTQEAVFGAGYGLDGVKVPAIDLAASLDASDFFGAAVSLNAAGDRLAVGAYGDDGATDSANNTGAVYLFSFSDTAFSGGTLEAVLGAGYSGGKNVDVANLEAGDGFGSGVSLNAAGDRLAVGARGDAGNGNAAADAGAVYLYSFTDTVFSGGTQEAIIGSGYSGGKNVNVANLEAGDGFGQSASLNAAGDRLAVGARQDDGDGNAATDAGAVYLYSFSDTAFTGGTQEAIIGSGYSGGKNVDVANLETGDDFGFDVSLNAAGDLLAAGARFDDGNGNSVSRAGAVYLFSFSDTAFSGGAQEAIIGSGYSGGKNVDMADLAVDDFLGVSVSLNAPGNRLAIGAYKDDGAGDLVDGAGAVYLFSFSDEAFSDAAQEAVLGAGYSGGKNVDVTNLEASDYFGYAVSLNAAGDLLAVGASDEDGAANNVTDAGAVYLFAGPGDAMVNASRYAWSTGETVTVDAQDIADKLAEGTSVTLQASNDLTVSTAVNVTGTPASVGALTLQAGRSILVDANIVTLGGDVSLIANDLLANGVIDAEREAGAAVIAMASGAEIDAGAGIVTLVLLDGAGKTYTASGDITLASITAGSLTVLNEGPTAGSGIVLQSGAVLTASGSGDAIVLAADTFTNNAGTSALDAASGNWQIWSGDPADDTLGGLTADYRQYNAVNGTSTVLGTGNGVLYTLAPVLTVALSGDAISKVYDTTTDALLAASNYVVSGAIQGDTVSILETAGSYDTRNAGTGKTVTVSGLDAASDVSASNGAMAVYGYQLASTSVSGAVGDITAATLTIGGLSADDKVYDALTGATWTGGSLVGVLGSDTVSLDGSSASAAFSDKNVGTGKTVTASGFALSGGDAGNYVLTQPSGLAADITAATLTIGGLSADDKVYDALTGATWTGGSLVGVLGSDTVSLDGSSASAAFSDKNVGTGKTVTASGFALSGGDAGNYVLTQPSGLAADITAATLTIGGLSADDKVYDALTGATWTGGSLVGVLGSDTVSLDGSSASAAFSDKNVGTGKTVTASGFALSGGDAGNYVLTQPSGLAADITAATLTIGGLSADDKVYDALTGATWTGGSLVGVLGSDTVSLDGSSASAAFSDKNVGTGKTVTASGFALSGGDAGNYVLTQPSGLAADITAATLTIGGLSADDKVYDALTGATWTGGSLVGVLGSDTVSLDGSSASAAFSDKNVGTGKTVTASGFALSGGDAGNYVLTQPSGLAADITAATLTIGGLSADDKVYDALTGATWTGGSLVGVLGSDTVSLDGSSASAAFSDKNVGTGKTVTASGFALSGGDAGNYVLTQPSGLAADITAATLTIGGLSADDKVYDALTGATWTGGSLVGVLGSDTVSLDGSSASAAFSDKNVGTGKTVTASGFALSGGDAGNYVLTQPSGLAADITAATLTIGGLSADDKVYDALTGATWTGGSLVGVLGSDTVSLDGSSASAAFSDKNVGTGKTVTASGFALSGGDAGNYVLTQPSGLAADITAATLTIGGLSADDKVYDALTGATWTGGSLVGVLGSDTVSLDGSSASAAFSDKNVGTGKTVTASGFALSGGDAGNYVLTQPSGLAADITAATLTIGGLSADDKVYDALTGATWTGGSLVGVLGSDTVSLDGSSASAAFSDKNVGTGKTVTASGFALSGGDAGNYVLTQPSGLAADITAATLTIGGLSADDKVYDALTGATWTGGSLVGVLGSDTVSLDGSSASAAFSDKNVGTGKTVTASGFALSGGDAGNYVLTQPSGLAADITAATLTIGGLSADDKVYDALTGATWTGGSLVGVLGSDTVSLDGSSASAAFSDKNVGTGKTVTASGFALSGGDAGNYVLTQPSGLAADITAATLTIGGLSADDKVYDALTGAPAKINLTLHVTGQREDGYHLLDSLVVLCRGR